MLGDVTWHRERGLVRWRALKADSRVTTTAGSRRPGNVINCTQISLMKCYVVISTWPASLNSLASL